MMGHTCETKTWTEDEGTSVTLKVHHREVGFKDSNSVQFDQR
jgi:hypothetical protein